MQFHSSYKTIIPLALSAFCMGVAELCIAGVMENIAHSFDISLQEAGFLTTLYAIGVIIGAPLLSIPLSAKSRKTQLLWNLCIFGIANFVVFISSSFYLTALARFVAGCMHGVFFVIATLASTQVAQKGKESQALSIMVSGLTLSMVSGVPLGAMIGNAFGYKILFLCIALLIFAVFALVWVFMPKHIEGKQTYIKDLGQGLRSPHMWRAFLVTACFCGSIFALYTYAEAFFVYIGGFDLESVPKILLVYGFFGIVGNLLGGKLADYFGSLKTLRFTLLMLALSFFLIGFGIVNQTLAVVFFCMISFWGFACVASVKMFAILSAKLYTPQTMDSSISLNEASFNLGIALATFIGGVALSVWGVQSNPFIACIIALCGVVLLFRIPKELYATLQS